ncbi:hypothetical protein HGM15179_020022, partial [Zosterops borbonicus]
MAAAGWYHRDISQAVAEELLAKAGRDGSFLVRDSESVKGAYALCLLMAAAGWYHRDISQAVAEELLAKAGRDGSFLVRDSESVKGAYALCLLFQRHVYTYRILPDDEGLLSVQTIQGIQAKCFRTLSDLIGAYQYPNNGLVTPLLHPVHGPRPDEDSGEPGRGQGLFQAGSREGPAELVTLPTDREDRLQEQVHSSLASDFMGFMAKYLTHHVQDLEALCQGHPQLRHLSTALATACWTLHSEIDFMLVGLESLATPLCPLTAWPGNSDPDLELLLNKISTVNYLLSLLEKEVLKSLQEMVTRHNLALPSMAVAPLPAARPLAVQNFEVKVGKSQHAALMVDVESGTVTVTKQGSGSPEEVIPQDKSKGTSVQSKVRLVCACENQKSLSRNFIFPNAWVRGTGCLLQLMKIQHSNLDEPKIISVYVGIMPPPCSLASWLTSRGLGHTQDETTACIPHDIYIISTQENSLGDRKWVEFLCASLKTLMAINYRVVALQCLWSIKIMVLVKLEHQWHISHGHASSVKTKIANMLGNKGAVGISFLFNETSFGFVNCNLTSGSEKTHRHNQNYSDILHSLALGDKCLVGFHLTLLFTHLFWFRDLNYCLDMDDILTHIVKKEFQALLAVDQLNLEQEKNKVFLQFNEGDISFPPMYHYERGTRDTYMWQKSKPTGMQINVPSWCDRILWKSHLETHVVCNSYSCTNDIVTNDHSPVFATLEVGVTSQFVPKEAPGSSPKALACIEWESIKVMLKTTSRSKCYIKFHSYCLEGGGVRAGRTPSRTDIPGFLKLGWSSKHLPVLNPILPNLGDQHLLLSIKGVETCESFGMSVIGTTAQQFETFLFHCGEEMGSVRSWMQVRDPWGQCGTCERLYKWISFEEEDAELAAEPPMCPKLPLQCLRSRPRNLLELATGHTNPAYFTFKGVPNAAVVWPAPLWTTEPVPWAPTQPPRVGHHKRPKLAILTRDMVGLGDCSLCVATHLSQLDQVLPQCRGDRQELPLHQTHHALELLLWPCQEVPMTFRKWG